MPLRDSLKQYQKNSKDPLQFSLASLFEFLTRVSLIWIWFASKINTKISLDTHVSHL